MTPRPANVIDRFTGPALRALSIRDVRLVRAVRAWSMGRIGGVDPAGRTAMLLGSVAGAEAFDRYMDLVLLSWSEPPLVCRPCCAIVSFDECTLAALVTLAGRADRPRFDALVMEMLDRTARDRLYARALAVAAAL